MKLRAVGSRAGREFGRLPFAFLTLAFSVILALGASAAFAADFVLNAVVVDMDGKPQSGIKVLLGRIEVKDAQTRVRADQTGTTDAAGKVTLKLSSSESTLGATVVEQPAGRIVVPVDGILRVQKGTTEGKITLISAPDATEVVPGGTVTTQGFFGETGTGDKYPPPASRSVTVEDGSLKLWQAYGPRQGGPVLVVQGFSLESDIVGGYEVYKAWFDLAQGLRQRGRDVWVLTFPDVRGPVTGGALLVAGALEKILDPARGTGKVDVLGHSLGGLAARYALARDEAKSPRGASAGKVRLFLSVDAPHQGMNVQVATQAALWSLDATAMLSPGLQNMLYNWVGATNFSADDCRFPEDGSIRATTAAHDAFYAALNALNGDGYPHLSRNVALAAGGMAARTQKVGDKVYQLKASLNVGIGSVGLCGEDYRARAQDVLAGSVFPGQILPSQFSSGSIRVELRTFMEPTMVPTASAIDLRSGVSKFERYFVPTLAQGTLLRHGDPIPGATPILLQQITDVPITSAVLEPAPPVSGWFRGPVTVTLRAASPYNDVSGTEASVDGGTWTAYRAPIVVSGDGVHRILARSRVAVGNVEDPAPEILVRIDGTAPTLTITAPTPREYTRGASGTITVAAADATSGIAAGTLAVKLNGQPVSAADPIDVSKLAAGSYTLEAAVLDNAGNVGTATLTFVVKE